MSEPDDDWRADDLWAGDDGDEADVGRAPICPTCGVTMLPLEAAHVLDTEFVCENPDCDAFGEMS
jgi:hypothetical protein